MKNIVFRETSMKIDAINYTNTNGYITRKTKQITNNPPYEQTYKNNINFNALIGIKTKPTLKDNVIEQAKKYGIRLETRESAHREVLRDHDILQLADFLLNHKIIENDGVKDHFHHILFQCYWGSAERNINNKEVVNHKLLRSNCNKMKEWVDFIVNHPIYPHPEVQRLLSESLSNTHRKSLEERKIMANYFALNPDKLDEFEVFDAFVIGDGYKKHMDWDDDFDPEDFKTPIETENAIEIEVPEEDLLPVSSLICSLDDINNYLTDHYADIDKGKIFNKPVTKDKESLLIALTHIQPNEKNTESYIKLINNMLKLKYIDYNQKDSMGIPAIAHVLNSQNKILFLAFTNCANLRYEPNLENEFKNITDPEFKDLVVKSRIFENYQNSGFEKIFGKPNAAYNTKH